MVGTTVRIERLGVVFGQRDALRDVTMSLEAGEFVGIVGPSGCGKSTLLRVLAGLQKETSGTVARGDGAVAMVFQQPTLLPWATARQNVELPLRLSGANDRERAARASETLTNVGLGDALELRPHQLSGGMQMRVALARAFVAEPSLLLLDEPFAALDDLTRQRLQEDLRAWWRRDRWTGVLVTHNVAEAVFLCQRVFLMSPAPGTLAMERGTCGDEDRDLSWRSRAETAALVGDIAAQLRSQSEAAR